MTDDPTRPFGPNAFVLDAKLKDYVLSPTHRVGANKARVFKSALGIGADQSDVLKQALLEAARSELPNFMREDAYGKHYAIVFELYYGEKSAFVRSLWTIKPDRNFAELVSAFVINSKRASSKEKVND